MVSVIVAISPKALAHLSGTLIGDFIESGTQNPDGSFEITLGPGTNGQLIAAAAQNPDLGGRFIAKVAEARTRGEAEAATRGGR